jgi:Undecaprenyl-phosphate glucose phosphotransferase
MKSKLPILLIVAFAMGDLLLLNLALWISTSGRLELTLINDSNELYLAIFSNLQWFYLLLLTRPYRIGRSIGWKTHLQGQISFVVMELIVILSLIMFFDKSYSANTILIFFLLFIPVSTGWRLLFNYSMRSIRTRRSSKILYVIIGEGDLAQDIRRNFRFHPEYGYKFMGYFTESGESSDHTGISDIPEFVKIHGIQEIYCCVSEISQTSVRQVIDFGLNNFIQVKLVTDNDAYQKGLEWGRDWEIPVLNAAAVPLDDPTNRVVKRTFDLLFTVFVMAFVLTWLIPMIMILIKLDSKGPVFFRQLRAGKSNLPFSCLKFRTMTWQPASGFVQATKNDSRITRIGKFLRKTSLDEFPQFFNVLSGDMSVVGPRPHPYELNDAFAADIRKLNSRHYVKPGITGLAQAMGYRGETRRMLEMKHRITLDRFYVENWSLLFDGKIIFMTVTSLLKGAEKAY